jgi:hypothetical protein
VLPVLAIIAFYATILSSESRTLNFFAIRFHFLVFLSARDILAAFCLHRICMRDGVYFRSLNLPKGFVLCRYRIILSIVVENRTSRKSRGKVIPAAAFLLPKPRPFLPDRLTRHFGTPFGQVGPSTGLLLSRLEIFS